MSHFLTEEQMLIQNSVREFCNDPAIKALAAKDSQREPGTLEENCWKEAIKMGYLGAWVPEEYGGMGYSLTTYMVILEELTRNGFPGTGPMTCQDLAMLPIAYWGTKEQKEKFLLPMASGKVNACGAVTDPAGLANFAEWGLTVTEDGDDYILNGTKVCVTSPHISDVKVVFGRAENSDFSSSVYYVEKGMPGLETGFQEKKIMDSLSDWGTIYMKNLRVPKINRVVDNGFGGAWMGPSYLNVAIMALTMCENAFNMTLKFTQQRTRYGKPLTDLQHVSHRLVDFAVRNENIRGLIYTAARLWDEERYQESTRLCSMAKLYATEAANASLHDATVLHGGVGFTAQAGIGRMWIGTIGLEIAEQPPDVHRDIVAKTFGIKEGWKNGQL